MPEELSATSFKRVYDFGPFRLDPRNRVLSQRGAPVPVTGKIFDLLAYFVEHPHRLLTKDELLAAVWAGTVVEEGNLARHVSMLRRALGEGPRDHQYIVTAAGHGYRFVAHVTTIVEHDVAGSSRPRPSAVAQASPAPATTPRGHLRAVGLVAAGGLAVAAAAVVVWRWPAGPPAASSAAPVHLKRLTLDAGLQTQPAWSPDGRFVAYAADTAGNLDIWIQPIAGGEAVQVSSDPADESAPAWSPDGQWLAFRSERGGGGIYVARPFGGAERRICGLGHRPRWSPDGTRLLLASGTGQQAEWTPKRAYVVDLQGTTPIEILPGFFKDIVQSPSVAWHPDGKRVSVWGYHRSLGVGVWTGNVPDGEPARAPGSQAAIEELVGRFWHVDMVWAPRGDALYFTAPRATDRRQVWRVRVDRATLGWTGAPEALTDGATSAHAVAVSPDGSSIALGIQEATRRLWSFRLGRDGRLADVGAPVTPPGAIPLIFDLSPDATHLLLVSDSMREPDRLPEVRARDIASGRERVVASDAGPWHALPAAPRWSRDKRQVAFVRDRGRLEKGVPRHTVVPELILIDQASGAERVLPPVPGEPVRVSWDFSADGRSLILGVRKPDEAFDGLAVQPVDPDARRRRLSTAPDRHASFAQVSPDGRWVAFAATADGLDASSLWVTPFAGGAPIRLTEGTVDSRPRWSENGRLLYFLSTGGSPEGRVGVWALPIDPGRGVAAAAPFPVFTATTAARMVPSLVNFGDLRVERDRLVVPIAEHAGSIWTLALR